ncbi:unnamed protein product [Prunus armeniaca]
MPQPSRQNTPPIQQADHQDPDHSAFIPRHSRQGADHRLSLNTHSAATSGHRRSNLLRLPVTMSPSWSLPRKSEDEEKYTCSTYLGMHGNSSLRQVVQILQDLSQVRK